MRREGKRKGGGREGKRREGGGGEEGTYSPEALCWGTRRVGREERGGMEERAGSDVFVSCVPL